MLVNEQQDDRSFHLPHVQASYTNSARSGTGFAPNELHLAQISRLPFSIFTPDNMGGQQSLPRNQLEYHHLL